MRACRKGADSLCNCTEYHSQATAWTLNDERVLFCVFFFFALSLFNFFHFVSFFSCSNDLCSRQIKFFKRFVLFLHSVNDIIWFRCGNSAKIFITHTKNWFVKRLNVKNMRLYKSVRFVHSKNIKIEKTAVLMVCLALVILPKCNDASFISFGRFSVIYFMLFHVNISSFTLTASPFTILRKLKETQPKWKWEDDEE